MRSMILGALAASFVVLSIALVAPRVESEEVTPVLVTNLPELQRIEGRVRVPDAIPHGRSERFSKLVVPPSRRANPGELRPIATVDASAFTEIVLSLHGVVSDDVFQSGPIGAVLLPHDDEIKRAWLEDAVALFPLEVIASAQSGTARFSAQGSGRVAFPAYDLLFFNETDRSVELDLHLFLTN